MAKKEPKKKATREAILAAARELVARDGPVGTTVRDITRASGSNVAAVNYYFRSKDQLVDLAMHSIVKEVNQERDRRLTAFEDEAGTVPIALRNILRALIEPILTTARAADGGSLYVRTTYLMRTARYAQRSREQFHCFNSTARRFVMAIQRTFPTLTSEEAAWNYEFARGTALHMLVNLDPLWRRYELLLIDEGGQLPEEPRYGMDEAQARRIIDLLVDGFGSKSQV